MKEKRIEIMTFRIFTEERQKIECHIRKANTTFSKLARVAITKEIERNEHNQIETNHETE
jgi:hypothetical protein